MSRHPSSRIAQRHDTLVARMRVRKAEHPFWGYRRSWADLRVVEQLPVHKKRRLRLRPAPHLLGTPQQRLNAQRTPMRSTPKPTRPPAWWGIDMTKGRVQDVGWVYSVVVLAWSTKRVVGYHADLRSTARHWLAALDLAVNRQCPHGVRGHGLSLMRDHGGQPTSVAFMQGN
jgi:putative transposase